MESLKNILEFKKYSILFKSSRARGNEAELRICVQDRALISAESVPRAEVLRVQQAHFYSPATACCLQMKKYSNCFLAIVVTTNIRTSHSHECQLMYCIGNCLQLPVRQILML